ncbi:MAG: acyl-CoA thioesterase [Bacteroidetes bacterium]|nr:acyl-CoA thioesterase [Bacteroidota bacterium]
MKKHTFEEEIYTYHIDFVGHVNNIIYVQWLENARVKLIEAMGLSITQIADDDDLLPIITETNIKYKKPYFLKNKVHIEVWISKMNNVSAIFEFRFFNEKEELCSTANQKVLFIDKTSMKPSRKIVKYKENFERYYVPE